MKSALVIPTLHAMPFLDRLLPALKALDPQPDKILFIDSSSADGTPEKVRAAGIDVHTIRREDFGHGRTRNLGVQMCEDYDVIFFLTHDAIPDSTDIIAKMLKEFHDAAVGLVYGRQLPHDDATLAAQYARLSNYPAQSHRTTLADVPLRGLKALFCSNSFAAYRVSALQMIGGFPEKLPLGEDMAAAGRLLEASYDTVYLADACVKHSHNYSIPQEFRRYFDIGALMNVDPLLKARRLKSGGSGLQFVRGELEFMAKNGNLLDIAGVFPRTLSKYVAYQMGRHYESLPRDLVRRCSMHSFFWKEPA